MSNDGIHYSDNPGQLTLYHSGCRSCPPVTNGSGQQWPMCVDREDFCYLDNSCFPEGEINPRNSCQMCRLERPGSWSPNEKNEPPVLAGAASGWLKATAYEGQLFQYPIEVEDDDPLTFRLTDPLTDAQVDWHNETLPDGSF